MSKVLYPGSFDPITKGHMNIIAQATELFDEVIVAVMRNAKKKEGLFSIDERVKLIQQIYKDNKKIKVVTSVGATVDVAIQYECKAIVRGLRGVSDFDQELQLVSINRKLSNYAINTVCLFADESFQYISSSMVKELYELKKDITPYVPEVVKIAMNKSKKSGASKKILKKDIRAI